MMRNLLSTSVAAIVCAKAVFAEVDYKAMKEAAKKALDDYKKPEMKDDRKKALEKQYGEDFDKAMGLEKNVQNNNIKIGVCTAIGTKAAKLNRSYGQYEDYLKRKAKKDLEEETVEYWKEKGVTEDMAKKTYEDAKKNYEEMEKDEDKNDDHKEAKKLYRELGAKQLDDEVELWKKEGLFEKLNKALSKCQEFAKDLEVKDIKMDGEKDKVAEVRLAQFKRLMDEASGDCCTCCCITVVLLIVIPGVLVVLAGIGMAVFFLCAGSKPEFEESEDSMAEESTYEQSAY